MTELRLVAIIIAALVAQVSLFADFRIFGVAPEVLVLLALLFGLLAEQKQGPTIAFIIGLLYDIYLPTPLGLSAIVFALLAYAAHSGGAELFRESKLQLGLIAAVGTFAGVAGYAALGEAMGQRGLLDVEMLRVALVAGAINAVLAPALQPFVAWALGAKVGRYASNIGV